MITNKGELAKDTKFKSICLNYGADWNKIVVFDDMYILNTDYIYKFKNQITFLY